MNEPPPNPPPEQAAEQAAEPPDPTRQKQVAEILASVEAGARQRRAELATVGAEREEARLRLLELKANEYVREPVPTSPRPLIGRLLIFARKAVYHFFGKWLARPVMEQQNAFNQAASRLLQELAEEQQRLARQLALLEARSPRSGGGEQKSPRSGGGEQKNADAAVDGSGEG